MVILGSGKHMNILLDEYSNREMNVISCTMNGFHHFKGMILNLRIHNETGEGRDIFDCP